MGKALFVGLSAMFFIAYSAIANALLFPTSQILPIGNTVQTNADECSGIEIAPLGPNVICLGADIPILGPVLGGIQDIFSTAAQIFGGFFQLITFNAGLGAASMVTLMIFVPLGFANAFIIFSAIRGSD